MHLSWPTNVYIHKVSMKIYECLHQYRITPCGYNNHLHYQLALELIHVFHQELQLSVEVPTLGEIHPQSHVSVIWYTNIL